MGDRRERIAEALFNIMNEDDATPAEILAEMDEAWREACERRKEQGLYEIKEGIRRYA